MGRAGCGVPRVCRCKQTPGGSGNPPSATTSGRNKRVHARLRRAMELADGEAHLLHPARDRANNRRGGAPRGERPTSLDARRPLAPAGHHHWPADGCRCTRAPVGAPLPSRLVRENRKPRRTNASREGRRLHGDRPRMTAPSPRALTTRRNTVRQTTAHGLPCGCAARPYVRK